MYIAILTVITVLLIILDIIGSKRKKATADIGLSDEEYLIKDSKRRHSSPYQELFFKDWKTSLLMFICLFIGIYVAMLAFRYSGFERGMASIVLGVMSGESIFLAIRFWCMK